MPCPPRRSPRYAAILAVHAHACRYCGEAADAVDHIVPRRLGGSDAMNNLTAACHGCNARKNDRRLGDALEREILAEAFVLADQASALAAQIAAARQAARGRRLAPFGGSASALSS